MGAAVVQWEEAHSPQPWTSANLGRSTRFCNIVHHPGPTSARWAGRRPRLSSKEFLDPEASAVYQAVKTFEARGETGVRYTVSQIDAAIQRAMSDRARPSREPSPR